MRKKEWEKEGRGRIKFMGNKAVIGNGRRVIDSPRYKMGNGRWTKGKRKAVLVKGRRREEEGGEIIKFMGNKAVIGKGRRVIGRSKIQKGEWPMD
jgi:hypothetical protein